MPAFLGYVSRVICTHSVTTALLLHKPVESPHQCVLAVSISISFHSSGALILDGRKNEFGHNLEGLIGDGRAVVAAGKDDRHFQFAALVVPHILTLLALSISPVHPEPLDLTSLPVADRDLAKRAVALLSPEYLPLLGEIAATEDQGHAFCGTLHALALRAVQGSRCPFAQPVHDSGFRFRAFPAVRGRAPPVLDLELFHRIPYLGGSLLQSRIFWRLATPLA